MIILSLARRGYVWHQPAHNSFEPVSKVFVIRKPLRLTLEEGISSSLAHTLGERGPNLLQKQVVIYNKWFIYD